MEEHITTMAAQGGTCMEVETFAAYLSGASLPNGYTLPSSYKPDPAVPIQDGMDVDFCLLYKMLMKRYWSRLLALVLVVVIGLTGCSKQ